MPERIQRKRTKGWRMPDGAIYVGRPTRWGNIYRIEKIVYLNSAAYKSRSEYVVELFRLLVTGKLQTTIREDIECRDRILASLHELRGHDLACWCPLDQPCHADVLLELANKNDATM